MFIGAGGGALRLLQSSGIPEAKGFGGFPISGQFLKTTNPQLVAQHQAKVYGKADIGAPPMSVPHLDTRVVDGGTALLFGPYAGWSMKFLKHGSWTDLIRSIRPGNLVPMLAVGVRNLDLLKYLIGEVTATEHQPAAHAAGVHAHGPPARLGARDRRPAGAGHQEGQGQGRGAGVRHRAGHVR